MPSFLFIFSQVHGDFRASEFKAVCDLFNIPFDESLINKNEHIYELNFESLSDVEKILSRVMLVKYAIELFAKADNYDELHKKIKKNLEVFEKYNDENQTFCIRIRPLGKKRDQNYINNAVDIFGDYLPLQNCKIDLVNPVNCFTVIEDYNSNVKGYQLNMIYFGRFINFGQGQLKTKYNLKDRPYIGNTTMDPELSFIQANLVLAKKGSLAIDPFVGTGGLILPLAEFGCYVTGTEINYQIARCIGKSSRVGEGMLTEKNTHRANFEKYGTLDKFLYHCHADASHHSLWRLQKNGEGVFDIIVADPPYGLREKGRKIGKKDRKEHWTLPGQVHMEHFPEKTKYDIKTMYLDILNMAARNLVINGRLGFWFPVFPAEYTIDVIPNHPCLKLVSNCEQPLGLKYSRRLLVYEKIKNVILDEAAFVIRDMFESETVRERIFVGNS
uniref:tRNA (guanine(10)-N2)-methyltransferase homolog (inferred by orthology to a human protein) n=1 Tax=Strongyloides venezuelensis TaxID=75913 RepID=A0A0K0FAG8_STRVS